MNNPPTAVGGIAGSSFHTVSALVVLPEWMSFSNSFAVGGIIGTPMGQDFLAFSNLPAGSL
jgi:hypothetical protein